MHICVDGSGLNEWVADIWLHQAGVTLPISCSINFQTGYRIGGWDFSTWEVSWTLEVADFLVEFIVQLQGGIYIIHYTAQNI